MGETIEMTRPPKKPGMSRAEYSRLISALGVVISPNVILVPVTLLTVVFFTQPSDAPKLLAIPLVTILSWWACVLWHCGIGIAGLMLAWSNRFSTIVVTIAWVFIAVPCWLFSTMCLRLASLSTI